jgi:hypothetical protein
MGVRLQAAVSAEVLNSLTVTATIGVITRGNTLVATAASWEDPNDQILTSITDNQGNGTYTVAVSATRLDSQVMLVQAYKTNVGIVTTPGTCTVTATWTELVNGTLQVVEYSGIATTPTVVTSTLNGSSTTPSTGVIDAGANPSTFVAAMTYNVGGPSTMTVTAGNGFSQLNEIDENNDAAALNVAEMALLAGAQGPQTCGWTIAPSCTWAAIGVAYSDTPKAVTQVARRRERRPSPFAPGRPR